MACACSARASTAPDEQYVNPLAQDDGMPGYAVQWMEVEGPLYDESTGAGYRLLFGDLPMRRVDAGQPGVALEVSPQQAVGPTGDLARGRGGPAGHERSRQPWRAWRARRLRPRIGGRRRNP